MKYTPWALADAARVCLAYGTEYQRSDATERDLLEVLTAYSSSGHHGPLPSWQGPAAQTAEERRDLPSTSSILANMAYRLLVA
ncbi:hypothetical protein [Streptomyces sp. NPDC046805]|uniref:hypothetical protein n=1 Tax=Streptomyces sp. NPDC046805 TaxID=3155134 RepID=UPI0033DC6809